MIYDYPAPPNVVRDYDPPEKRWQAGHRGVDLDLGEGLPIFAAADGIVHFAGKIDGSTSVSVMHADGIRTTYGPIETELKKGDRVKRGQILGRLGARTGQHPEPGLHWGALRGQHYLNPMDLVKPRKIVLKPTRI